MRERRMWKRRCMSDGWVQKLPNRRRLYRHMGAEPGSMMDLFLEVSGWSLSDDASSEKKKAKADKRQTEETNMMFRAAA
jgi:hypothetical protein